MKPDLQQRILDVLSTNGSVPAKDIPHWLRDVDRIALDCGLGALVRLGKITLSANRYDLARPLPKPRNERGVVTAEAINADAQRELATSTKPLADISKSKACKSCEVPKPLCEFRRIGSNDERADECNKCHGERAQYGRDKAARARGERRAVELPAAATPETAAAAVTEALASKQPVIADHVFDRVTAQRLKAQEAIQNHTAQIIGLNAEIERCDEFLRLYAGFAAGAA